MYQVLKVLDFDTTRRRTKKRREKKKQHTKKKLSARWDSNHHAEMLMALILSVHPLSYMVTVIDMYSTYTSMRTTESWDILIKKRKQNPSQGDDAGTAEGTTCRVGRGEQGVTSSNQRTERWTSSRSTAVGHLRLKNLV